MDANAIGRLEIIPSVLREVGHGAVRAEVDRLVALGARPIDVGQGGVDWVVMVDPNGNEFCVPTASSAFALAVCRCTALSPDPRPLPMRTCSP